MPIHDNWWQTETGGIMIANYLSMPIRPGSMGKPLPGIEAAIVQPHKDGTGCRRNGTRCPGRAGVAAGLAIDVPRLSARRRALSQVLRRRLVPDRRSRPERCATAITGLSAAPTM